MTSFPQLSNCRFSPRHRRGLSRFGYSFEPALGTRTGSPFNFKIEPKNIILVVLRAFGFSHGLDRCPERL